jgi:signal transduction histidine kinase
VKLISKSILYYLIISLPLLVIACLCSYYLIRAELRDGTDEILQHEQINAEQLIRSSKILNTTALFPDNLFTIKIVAFHTNNSQYSDTTIYDKLEKEFINYRVFKSFYNYNKTTYLISILKPTLEENELMEGLISSLFLVICFLILSFLLVNWILSKLLWKSFYSTIARLNEYELKKNEQLHLKPSNIKEFNELNEALLKMTNKIYADFVLQKEFTENASHEIQTPLAVIKSKLELLMQSENLKEYEMQQIQVIETSVNKLSSLNKALLLLVKIENRQFEETHELSLQKKIEKNLLYYKHLIDDKGIVVKATFVTELFFKMNDELCDILLTNLLQNAIRHNFKNGHITLAINKNTLTITNTGSPIQIKPKELFERFRKETTKQESLGIGLAIVKSICDVYAIDINYIYKNNEHTFKLNFPFN